MSSITYKQVDYTNRFGITDLSEYSIWKRIQKFKKENILFTLDYLSSKLGYTTADPNSFSLGKEIAAGWNLIDQSASNAINFYC